MRLKPKPALSYAQQQGFTLLELMVVLVIIGSLLGMVTVTYQVDDDEEVLVQTRQSLRLFLQHKIDQSWLDGDTLGAQVTAQEISIKLFDLETETWEDTQVTWSPDEDEVEIILASIDSDEDEESQVEQSDLVKEVDIAFVASGEYTPFEIEVNLTNGSDLKLGYWLTGDGVNALKLSEN